MSEQFYKLTSGEALVLRSFTRRYSVENYRTENTVTRMADRAVDKLYNPLQEAPSTLTRADWELIRETLAEGVMTRKALSHGKHRQERLEELLRKLDS